MLMWLLAVVPPQVSLFLDVLKCLCSDLTRDQFVSEERAGCSSAVGPQGAVVRSGRAELWRILRGAPLSLGQFLHLLRSLFLYAAVACWHVLVSQCTSPAVATTTWLCLGRRTSTDWAAIGRGETLSRISRWLFLPPSFMYSLWIIV